MKAFKNVICLSLCFFCLSSNAKKLEDLAYIIDQFEPYNYQTEDGHIQGFAVDILNQVWRFSEYHIDSHFKKGQRSHYFNGTHSICFCILLLRNIRNL